VTGVLTKRPAGRRQLLIAGSEDMRIERGVIKSSKNTFHPIFTTIHSTSAYISLLDHCEWKGETRGSRSYILWIDFYCNHISSWCIINILHAHAMHLYFI